MRRLAVGLLLVVLVSAGAAVPADSVRAVAPAYTATDLGTLGGGRSRATAVNARGKVVGSSAAADGVAHAFLWQDGRMTDLGTLGLDFAEATGINERGQVVGTSYQQDYGRARPFLWENGKLTDLGTLGAGYGIASAINDRGQVVGANMTADFSVHAFRSENGAMRDLGTLGGASSWAEAIDGRGRVVGSADTADGHAHAFLWENGVMTDLGTLGGTESQAWGINERGQVVGTGLTADGSWHAFLWESGSMTDLGTLDGTESGAYGINGRGQVVGRSGRPVDKSDLYRAFVWRAGVLTDLGDGVGYGVNERGDVVGVSGPDSNGRAVMWSLPAPSLTDRRPGTGRPLRASRSGTSATVSTLAGVDLEATVSLVVRERRSGKRLTLLKGSRLAGTTLAVRAGTARAEIDTPQTFAVRALLPTRRLERGAVYQLVLTATGINGKTTTLTIGFLG